MKLNIDGLNKAEREHILSQFTLVELYQELHKRANQDVEEEEIEDWEDEFEFQSKEEEKFAYQQIVSKYPHEVVKLVKAHLGKLPLWLRKEILMRREVMLSEEEGKPKGS